MKTNYLLVWLALLATLPAQAHDRKGPNGGRVADAGPYHVELVASSDGVQLYIADTADKSVQATGFKGIAILTAGGKPQRIVLEATEPARLSGKTAVSLPKDPKGAVQLTGPDGKTVTARFQ